MRKLVIVVLLLLAVFSFIGAYSANEDTGQGKPKAVSYIQKDDRS